MYYYHFDGLGSVVALSDVNTALVERYTYDVFGRPTIRDPNGVVIDESAFANPYLFTGRAWDAETALYYYRARYYDYATARFLQPDPMGYIAGLNLHTYCANNPLNYVDPSGLRAWWADTVDRIGEVAGGIYDAFHATDDIRGPVGVVFSATGGSLVAWSLCASNPAGWAIGAGLVCLEVGAILELSDRDVWGRAEKAVKPIRDAQAEREKIIDDWFPQENNKSCPKRPNSNRTGQ